MCGFCTYATDFHITYHFHHFIDNAEQKKCWQTKKTVWVLWKIQNNHENGQIKKAPNKIKVERQTIDKIKLFSCLRESGQTRSCVVERIAGRKQDYEGG